MKLEFKDGVVFTPTTACLDMIPHVMAAYKIFAPHIETLTVTSANDSKHMDGSKHYEDNALDFRVWDMSTFPRWAIVKYLNYVLGPDYQFVGENDHIHGEYDPR